MRVFDSCANSAWKVSKYGAFSGPSQETVFASNALQTHPN